MPAVWVTQVWFPSKLFFNHQVCNGCEGYKVSFIFQVFVFIFSFFFHSHSRTREVQLVSQLLVPQDYLHQTQMMLGILKFKVRLPLH
jgi:hypothetical protein